MQSVGVGGDALQQFGGLAGCGDCGEPEGVAETQGFVQCGEVAAASVALQGDIEEQTGEGVSLRRIQFVERIAPVRGLAAVDEQG